MAIVSVENVIFSAVSTIPPPATLEVCPPTKYPLLEPSLIPARFPLACVKFALV